MTVFRFCIWFCLWPLSLQALEPSDVPKDTSPLPLFEYGLGAATAFLPDYPGSDQNHLQTLPFPYAVFRGEILRTERGGAAKARLLKTDIYEFNLSASGGLPADSSKNAARKGMPDLDWTGELGPRLVIRLLKLKNGSFVNLGMAIRAAASTDFGRVDGRGFVFAPEVQFRMPNIPRENWSLFFSTSTMWADRRYMQYYYEVDPEFETPERRTYQARGGYFGSDVSAGISMPLSRDLQLAFYSNLTSFDKSANEASPLMRSKTGWYHAVVLIWTIGKSEQLAKRLEDEDIVR